MARIPPLEFRRQLRERSTDAERELWSRLRARGAGAKFRRQHTVGPYTLDFYCPAARVAVEVDGAQHHDGDQSTRDLSRDAWLAARGIRVLRYSDHDALRHTDDVVEDVWRALQRR